MKTFSLSGLEPLYILLLQNLDHVIKLGFLIFIFGCGIILSESRLKVVFLHGEVIHPSCVLMKEQ